MDVGAWLRSLGLEQYEKDFLANRIDGEVLPRLTSEDLREIGVAAVGDRRKLLDAIYALGGEHQSLRSSPSRFPRGLVPDLGRASPHHSVVL